MYWIENVLEYPYFRSVICTCSHPHEKVTPEKQVSWVNVVVQTISCMWLSATSGTVACQPPLSSAISWSLLIFMSIESVMPSNHLTLCCLLLNWCEISFWRQGVLPYAWGHGALWTWVISYEQEHRASKRQVLGQGGLLLSYISVIVIFSPYTYGISVSLQANLYSNLEKSTIF